MESLDLLNIISTGETSKVQFKSIMPHPDSVAQEIVAMANSYGGMIIFGIEDKTNLPLGISKKQVESFDRIISQIADNIKPPIYIKTEVINIGDASTPKNILIIHVPNGINKPYKTYKGEIYIKQGANKRLVVDNNEIMRLFQLGRNLLADEMEVPNTSINNIDEKKFRAYFQKDFGVNFEDKGLSYEQALKAKRVLRNECTTLAGLLFFGFSPQIIKPAFTIKVVSYFGNDIGGTDYRCKPEDLTGTIPELFDKCLGWLKNNLKSVQASQQFNSIGQLEIAEEALIELIQNALVHRDYFKNAPIRVLLFDNRLEIISPGRLPNTLTVEDIKYGNPVVRNNQLVSYASKTMPFSGLGSGIKRALEKQQNIEFINDIDGDKFIVIIPRVIDT